jgi:hypothetical protein
VDARVFGGGHQHLSIHPGIPRKIPSARDVTWFYLWANFSVTPLNMAASDYSGFEARVLLPAITSSATRGSHITT